MTKRACRTCGETLKPGYYHRHTQGERDRATALRTFWCEWRTEASEATRVAVGLAAYRAARRETEVA